MTKEQVINLEAYIYSISEFEYNKKTQKFMCKITRHNLNKLFEMLESYIKEEEK